MTHLNKFLALSILMTVINVPMYFYSKSLGQSHLSDKQVAHQQSAQSDSEIAANFNASPGELQENTALAAPEPLFNEQMLQDMVNEDKPERFKSLADLYKPPLYGKCKKLFERFKRKHVEDKPYKAFVYSYDGETAYCADAYTDKGQEAAEEIVLRECEAHHSGSGKYSPCRIYASE